MTNYNVVLLYSKFSEACGKILKNSEELDLFTKSQLIANK